MINLNELRIGNWLITENGVYQQVAYIGETVGFYNDYGGTDKHQRNPILSYDIEKIKPIPLSPELLELIGFEKRLLNNSFYEYYLNCTPPGYKKHHEHKFSYFDTNGFRSLDWKPYLSGAIHSFPCDALHQLQNLYFALTGIELVINLKEPANA